MAARPRLGVPPLRRRVVAFYALVVGVPAFGVLVACGGGSAGEDQRTTVNVFAAASLTDAFTELAAAFENANPDLQVRLNLAGSSSLRAQILDGAPADVFASANERTMDQVIDGGAIDGSATVFATNRLTIAVPEGNPAGVTGLADFGRTELFIGLCDRAVPCGDLAATELAAAGIEPAVDSYEPDVRALLTKIAEGELDAGLVYTTDIAADAAFGSVGEVIPPEGLAATARYPIATVADGPAGDGAERFVTFVLGDEGRAVLAGFGFGAP
ncbi:MAG: molybdate ABC transporter substrate-binding protein [Actinomycetota bacterium]